MIRAGAVLVLCAASVRGLAAPKMDVLAGTWRDDFTDLAGLGSNKQGALAAPSGYSVDPGLQTYTNPYDSAGFSEYFSAAGAVAGDTLRFENPGATTERLTLWNSMYSPQQQFQYAFDCVYNLTGAFGSECQPNKFQNGEWSATGIRNAPYAGGSLLYAAGWDVRRYGGCWPGGDPSLWSCLDINPVVDPSDFYECQPAANFGNPAPDFVFQLCARPVVALLCGAPIVPSEGDPTTGTIGAFYGQPLLNGLQIDQILPNREYTATWITGAYLGAAHQGHSATSYLLFQFRNLDTKAAAGGTTLYEGDFLNYTLPEFGKSPVAEPLDFGALTPVAIHLDAVANAAQASWDLEAVSLTPPAASGGHPHCTAIGPAWLVADRATYTSPVFDSGSNFTRWVDICWDIDMSTVYVDSSASPIPAGSPLTPVRLGYGVSSVLAPVLPVSWTVSHGGEAIPGVIGRNMIPEGGLPACNSMQDAKGAPLVGRYFQWSATLFGRNIAQEVDADLEPSPRPIFFGGLRPSINRISVHYYVCSAVATSKKIAPSGVSRWRTLEYVVEKPTAGASVVVDVVSGTDGSVLLANVPSGASLAGINPLAHASLVLRATLESDPADCDQRPILRAWQASWEPLVDVILVSCNAIRPALGEVCKMQVRVERPGRAVVEVHDAAGQLVTTLLDGEVGAGAQLVGWDGRGRTSGMVAPGVYFLHARVPGGRRVVRVAVLR